MDVKSAVTTAKRHIIDLFAEEDIKHLGLEEVEFRDEEGSWYVTLAFSRPWDTIDGPFAMLKEGMMPKKSFKVVRIVDANGEIASVKNRDV